MVDKLLSGRAPAWSPDGGKIAFVGSYQSLEDQICVMDADGSNQTNLTNHPSRHEAPAWAPGGDRIAFVRSAAGIAHSGIYVMDADGSGQKSVCEVRAGMRPTWSPDGSRIAFAAYVLYEGYFINVVDEDGSNRTVLCNGIGPSWSPDGGKIAFTIYEGGEPFVGVVNTDGTDRTMLGRGIAPVWTPDGKVALFAHEGDMNMYAMDADGSNKMRLTASKTLGEPLGPPAWTSDGRAIVFRDKNHDLRLMKTGDSGSFPLVPGAGSEFVWSPDGTRIAFAVGSQIHVVHTNGSGRRKLVGQDPPSAAPREALSPTPRETGTPRIELVYGDGGEGLVFLEKNYALDIGGFREALYKARTWGELKARVSGERYEETVAAWVKGQSERLRDDGDLEDDEPEVTPPGPHDAFDAEELPGYADGDWPEFAPTMMENWVDGFIISEYGGDVQPTLNAEYPVIDFDNEEEVVSLLEEQGYVCISDEDLVWKAIWGG